jgi:glycosyltransferase involved in cell wall biosynthesis
MPDKNLRICYFADGRSVHTLRWIKFCVAQGDEMHLISFSPMSERNIADFENLGVKCHGAFTEFHIKNFWLTLKNLREIKTILRREKIDILHCHYLGINGWYAALSGFRPYIITIMGGGDVIGENWKPDSSKRERILTPLALKKAAAVTSWSPLMADVVRPYCRPETPIEVIHGGIHLENFYPSPKPQNLLERWEIPSDAKIIFSPRLMRPLSNIHQIARAARKISDAFPNTFYLVAFPNTVVDGEYAEQVKQIFAESGVSEKVRFVSEISHHEIADYFRLADLTISVAATDGTPMTVLESMACETPTIIGNLPDYDKRYFEHEKTTLMIDINNADTIADAALQYWKDVDLIKKITAEARQRVIESGSYETQMSKMDNLYRNLISK